MVNYNFWHSDSVLRPRTQNGGARNKLITSKAKITKLFVLYLIEHKKLIAFKISKKKFTLFKTICLPPQKKNYSCQDGDPMAVICTVQMQNLNIPNSFFN